MWHILCRREQMLREWSSWILSSPFRREYFKLVLPYQFPVPTKCTIERIAKIVWDSNQFILLQSTSLAVKTVMFSFLRECSRKLLPDGARKLEIVFCRNLFQKSIRRIHEDSWDIFHIHSDKCMLRSCPYDPDEKGSWSRAGSDLHVKADWRITGVSDVSCKKVDRRTWMVRKQIHEKATCPSCKG